LSSVREILEGIGYTLRDDGAYYRAKPLYRDSGNPTSLRIHKDSGRFTDFSANFSGSLEDLVKLTTGQSVSLNELKFEPIQRKETLQVQRDWHKEWEAATLVKSYKFYLERGIPVEVLEKFGARLCQSGKMTRRIVFPIKDQIGKIIGISGRSVVDNPIKWKHLGVKSDFIFPIFCLGEIRLKREVILVESIGDAMALYAAGVKNILCLFGVALLPKLAAKLIELNVKKIIIATNNDKDNQEVGNRAAVQIEDKLSNFFDNGVIEIRLPIKKDFGNMTPEEIGNWYDDSSKQKDA
jgi:5S rRNA maturation endonuclease (ribonuclease M5)